MAYSLTTDTALTNLQRTHCKIDDNKFIVAKFTSTDVITFSLMTFSGSSVSEQELTNTLGAKAITSIVALTSSKFIVTYIADYDSYYHTLKCVCVTISGTTLTYGTVANILNVSSPRHNDDVSICRMADDKFFIYTHVFTNEAYMYCCTVSGTTITVGSGASNNTAGSSTQKKVRVISIGTDKVAITYSNDYGYPSARICTVSGTTITVGKQTNIRSSSCSGATTSCPLESDKFVMFYKYSQVQAAICTVSGTTITVESDTAVTDQYLDSYTIYNIDCATFSSTSVFFINGGASSSYGIYITKCTISGNSISFGSKELVNDSSYLVSSVSISDKNATIIRNGYYRVAYEQSGPSNLKTWNGIAKANIKTWNGVATGSIKSYNGIT